MRYSKNNKWFIGFSRLGARAGEDCKVWQKGIHRVKTSDFITLRIVYKIDKQHTYYWEVGHRRKEIPTTMG